MGTVRYTVVNGEVIAEKRNDIRKEYVPDPLGSVAAMLDDTQTITDTFSYWPYGEVASRTGGTTTPFQFVGSLGYYKDSAAMTYVRTRHLDGQVGCWTTEDPIGFEGGDYNLYRYGLASPSTIVDPSGLQIHPPHPPMTDKEACDEAKACGGCPPSDLGCVACNGGKRIACVYYTGPSPVVKACILRHEHSHMGDKGWQPCPEGPGFGGVPGMSTTNSSECKAWTDTFACLSAGCSKEKGRAKADCDSQKQLACRQGKRFCSEVSLPWPYNKECAKINS